jgi:deoxyribonuclease V
MFFHEKKYEKYNEYIKGYINEQRKLSKKLVLKDHFFLSNIKTVAGVDQAFLGEDEGKVLSCFVILNYENYENMELIEHSYGEKEVDFPYIPGLLAYREMPAILEAYEKLKQKPDVILVDGHGIAHPRNFGLASHLGFLLKKPTIGVAKRKLVGEFEEPKVRGECKKLKYKEKPVGYVLKTKENSKPIFISPGNLISLESSLKIIKSCLREEEKLPEPIRLAHKFVNEEKRKCQNLA